MAIDINSLRKEVSDKPPILLVYSPEGMGKTSLAHSFPDVVFIQTEDGAPRGMTLDTFGIMESVEDVMDALAVLASEDTPYKTVAIDSVSKLEKLVWAQTCARHNVSSIEEVLKGYGKGYLEADKEWGELVEACRYLRDKRGMTVLWLGHAVTTKFDDPETQSYSRYEVDLHKRALAMLARESDAILLIKKDVTVKLEGPQAKKGEGRARGDGGDTRWIYTESRPAFMAKNRFTMPDKLMFIEGKGYEVLAPYLNSKLPEVSAKPTATASKKAA
jgi:hypothetical protein